LPEFQRRTKIAQLSITACSVQHILELKNKDAIPRVLHKLSICLNPFKLIKLDTSEINGLTNELLENEKKFDKSTVDLINSFLAHLQQPVCLVAHNGQKFDFRELQSYCKQLNKPLLESLLCCDSLFVFMEIDKNNELEKQQISMMDTEKLEMDNKLDTYDSYEYSLLTLAQLEEHFIRNNPQVIKSDGEINDIQQLREHLTVKSGQLKYLPQNGKVEFPMGYHKLREIYNRFFGAYPAKSHDSEDDVITLLKCVCACKKQFLEITMRTATNFSDVKEL
jgi:hypothetical protein